MYQLLTMAILIFLINPINAYSQYNKNNGPKINIIFPTNGDTSRSQQIRIAGNTAPHAKVMVANQSVKVFPSGAFAGNIKLIPKWNEIIISAKDSTGSSDRKLYIFCVPSSKSSPLIPTEIDETIIIPNQNMIIFSGDILQVRFKGSPGGEAKFSIDKICKNVPMTELPPDEADGILGIYSGVITVYTEKDQPPEPIEFELKGIDGQRVKISSTSTIEVRTHHIPLVGELIEKAELLNDFDQWSVLSTLPDGVKVHIIGKIGELYKVRLSLASIGYIQTKSVRLLPSGTPIPHSTISLPVIRYEGNWIQLSMDITTACPFVIHQSLNPSALELTVYNAHLTSQWITYPNQPAEIKLISWSQPGTDEFRLKVDLNQPQQWGHRIKFAPNRMILEIRRTPNFAKPPNNPMKGLTIAVDAGHGGEEKGAIGATGLMEKDVNLLYAKKLATLLENAGVKVVLTRTTDSTMSLEERVEIARRANAHIFCWLHNNSIGDTANPLAVRGTSAYFTVPQNQSLAWTVYARLVEIGLQPFGKIQSTYYVTRQTDMLVVLVEGAFISHPEDEMLLMNDKFIDRLAKAVFGGLEDFCRAQQMQSIKTD